MTQDDYLIYGFCIVVGIIIWVALLRFATRANTIVKHNQVQTALLKMMAEKAGVTKEEMEGIINWLK